MSLPEDAQYDVELGPLFAVGAIVLAYGLLRRKPLSVAVGIGAIWLDQRSEFGRTVKRRANSALKAQIKAHARPDGSDPRRKTGGTVIDRLGPTTSALDPSVPRSIGRETFVRESLRNPSALAQAYLGLLEDSKGLAHRRTKPWARGPRGTRARSALVGASDVVRRAGHDLCVGAVEVEDDDRSVVVQHVGARADLVDLTACADLPQQVDGLTRFRTVGRSPSCIRRRRERDVGFRSERFPYPTAPTPAAPRGGRGPEPTTGCPKPPGATDRPSRPSRSSTGRHRRARRHDRARPLSRPQIGAGMQERDRREDCECDRSRRPARPSPVSWCAGLRARSARNCPSARESTAAHAAGLRIRLGIRNGQPGGLHSSSTSSPRRSSEPMRVRFVRPNCMRPPLSRATRPRVRGASRRRA